MLNIEEALKAILDHATPLTPVTMALDDAADLVLAEDVMARGNVPPFANSAMDGFAVIAADIQQASESTPARLHILEDVPAGSVATQPVRPSTAIRIMTGAPLPDGADTVVHVEVTRAEDDDVLILLALKTGVNVRQAGEDMKDGAVVLTAGAVLRPGEVGVCAAAGHATVTVYPRARVAVLTTGSELVDAAQVPGPGQIRDANAHSLRAQVAAMGAEPVVFARVPDTREAMRSALEQALAQTDVVLTNGGVSVGDYDFVKDVLREMGAELVFWRVKQKPGKPMAFWTLGSKRIVGLPGNPVSCMVCTEEYVRPLVRRMMGHGLLYRPVRTAVLDERYAKGSDAGRAHFARVRLQERDGVLHAALTGPQGSGILTSMALAVGIAVLPEETPVVEAGQPVHVQLTDLPEDH
ncbi:MAG: molybdopterin molybdotransferase MoeA [Caldiserica bacterium]|nr:molybdopterin molybdotransferase MoeA [Caldisericota bacterium]